MKNYMEQIKKYLNMEQQVLESLIPEEINDVHNKMYIFHNLHIIDIDMNTVLCHFFNPASVISH